MGIKSAEAWPETGFEGLEGVLESASLVWTSWTRTSLGGFQHNKTLQLDIKAVQWCVSYAHRRKRQVFGPQTDSPRERDIHFVEIIKAQT